MAKQKYSEFADALATADTLDGTEPVVIIQDGLPVQTTTQDIADLGGGWRVLFEIRCPAYSNRHRRAGCYGFGKYAWGYGGVDV